MAPTEDDHYHPKDAIHIGLKGAVVYGGVGLLFAAVRNSLAKKNVGPWTTFTKNGGIILTFGMLGRVCLCALNELLANLPLRDYHRRCRWRSLRLRPQCLSQFARKGRLFEPWHRRLLWRCSCWLEEWVAPLVCPRSAAALNAREGR